MDFVRQNPMLVIMKDKQEFAEGVVKVHIKKLTALLIVICASMFLTSCAGRYSSEEFWGSYSSDRTFSYDHKLYATQTVDDSMIVVTIYNAETNAEIYSFSPARASDFWGICWEKDSYNIWIQSADIGEYCFEYKNEKWTRNESLTPPNYIISKYDEKYKNNSALWENIYHSPKE